MKTVNRRLARIFAIVLSAIMLVTNMGTIEAEAAATGFETIKGDDTFLIVEPGKTTHFSIPIRVNKSFENYRFLFSSSNDLISVQNIKTFENETEYEIVTDGTSFQEGRRLTLEFDVVADENLKIGTNKFTIQAYGIYHEDFIGGTKDELDLITFTTYTATELMGPDVVVAKVDYSSDPIPGSNINITATLKNVGDIALINVFTTVDLEAAGMIPNYTVSKIKVGELGSGRTAKVDIPVKVLATAEAGLHTIKFNITGKTKDGTEKDFTQIVYVTIPAVDKNETKNDPSLTVTTEDNYKEIIPGTNGKINLKLENKGEAAATDITVTCEKGFSTDDGITKNYTTDAITSGKIKAGKSSTVEIPYVVAKSIASGLHEIVLKVSYKDGNGREYSENITVYLFVSAANGSNPDGDASNAITIKNVTQSPAEPKAGEKVTISFDVVNGSAAALNNFKVSGENLSSANFEPLTNDPYVSVGTIAANSTKHVNVSFKCGKNISEGLNTLKLIFTYTDASQQIKEVSESVYVLNVIAAGADIGRPKLIVSDYGTDQDMLKAGAPFNFHFTLKNTHTGKDAKNIKITLSQAEGIFEPAEGTNIFYIEEIKAGTSSTLELAMKSRVDAVTGDYPIVLLVEYEYDDMSDADKEKGGVSEENTIKLRVIENYRPAIENIAIDSWAGVNVNEAADLNFEFYNMGKSVLGNVFVTVEGDFMLANNSSMSYVGAVQGYSSEYVTLSVVPLVGGEASGTVTVHFEDSNGDEVTLSQDFSQFVNDNGGGVDPGFDPGMIDPGFDPGMSDPGFDPDADPDGETGKKILGLPIWLFIVICVVVVAGITTGTVLIIKKRKNSVKDIDDEDY